MQEPVQWELSPDSCYQAHELPGGQLMLSFHHKWLASVAADGRLLLRLVEKPVSDSIFVFYLTCLELQLNPFTAKKTKNYRDTSINAFQLKAHTLTCKMHQMGSIIKSKSIYRHNPPKFV